MLSVTATMAAGVPGTSAAQAQAQQQASRGQAIRSELNGKCLDVRRSSPYNGAAVQLWDCGGAANQRWRWVGSTIRSELNGKCLDVRRSYPYNGAAIQLWDCGGAGNQGWQWRA